LPVTKFKKYLEEIWKKIKFKDARVHNIIDCKKTAPENGAHALLTRGKAKLRLLIVPGWCVIEQVKIMLRIKIYCFWDDFRMHFYLLKIVLVSIIFIFIILKIIKYYFNLNMFGL
jgi:hypothetical protein